MNRPSYESRPLEPVRPLPDRYVMRDAQGTVVHDIDLGKARRAHAQTRKYRRT